MSSCNQSERDREMLFLEGIPMRESLVIITTRGVGKGYSDNRIFLRNAQVKKFRRDKGAPVFVEGGRLCHGTMASPSLKYVISSSEAVQLDSVHCLKYGSWSVRGQAIKPSDYIPTSMISKLSTIPVLDSL